MRATWEDLPQKARDLVLARRHVNRHAAGLYFHLVTFPRMLEEQILAEYLADAADEAERERILREWYPNYDADAWDVGTTDDDIDMTGLSDIPR